MRTIQPTLFQADCPLAMTLLMTPQPDIAQPLGALLQGLHCDVQWIGAEAAPETVLGVLLRYWEYGLILLDLQFPNARGLMAHIRQYVDARTTPIVGLFTAGPLTPSEYAAYQAAGMQWALCPPTTPQTVKSLLEVFVFTTEEDPQEFEEV